MRANTEAFAERIDELDALVRDVTATVPPENRKLLTYHDSFPYFAREYGWDVIGAIQPADFAEPTAQDVAALIDQIRAEHVPAIFGSEVFPSPVLEQIADETGAQYIDDLRDDDLPGDNGDPDHSYFGLMVFDFRTFMGALGGDVEPVRRVRRHEHRSPATTVDYAIVNELIRFEQGHLPVREGAGAGQRRPDRVRGRLRRRSSARAGAARRRCCARSPAWFDRSLVRIVRRSVGRPSGTCRRSRP